MGKFISDMIHMTEGEKMIEYWWLWLSITIVIFGSIYLSERKRKQ